MTLNNP